MASLYIHIGSLSAISCLSFSLLMDVKIQILTDFFRHCPSFLHLSFLHLFNQIYFSVIHSHCCSWTHSLSDSLTLSLTCQIRFCCFIHFRLPASHTIRTETKPFSASIKRVVPKRQGFIVQELCESRGGRPGLSVLTSLLVSVDVKLY